MFPNYLGIGVYRSGTTWLHELLATHPDAYVPTKRKELYWFSNNWDKGRAWYEDFFPETETAGKVAVGEVTPGYFYSPDAARRIRDEPSIRRLILIIRDPANRAFSNYTRRIKLDNYQGDFRQFLKDYPDGGLSLSRYADNLELYRSLFNEEELLILIYEQLFKDIPAARERVAAHLGLDPARFPETAGLARVNAVVVPKHAGLYKILSKTGRMLRKADLDWLPNLIGRKLGMKRMLGKRAAPMPKLTAEDRAWFIEQVADDIDRVEAQLGVDLSAWRT